MKNALKQAVSSLPLSPREQEIVLLLLADLPDKEIADRLNLGHDTARTYLKIVRRKLGVRSRVGIVLAVYEKLTFGDIPKISYPCKVGDGTEVQAVRLISP